MADSEAMAAKDGSPEGLVLEIQRLSTDDGPGLRTTAFLKGCPLSCAWCHNPEGIEARPEPQWIGSRCIAPVAADGCGACARACPRGALTRTADGVSVIDRDNCDGCGRCAEACPGGAMELLGARMDARSLAAELLKDRAWWKRSDRGGVTLSGGEASAQGAFSREVFRLCRAAGAHTALDTSAFAAWEILEGLYAEADLVLYDLKEADPVRHRAFTGLGNELVLRNFERTAELMRRSPMPGTLWIRTPVIPGATAREENMFQLGRIIAEVAPPRLERWELCAFNRLCADKYERLGRDWAFAGSPLMEAAAMEALAEAARSGSRGRVQVLWTGAVRLEKVTAKERKQL